MNSKLFDLYNSHWAELSKHLREVVESRDYEENPTNPLLLNIGEQSAYDEADFRIMIFGQETNSWHGDFNGDITQIQKSYDDFFTAGYCFKVWGTFFGML